MKIMKIIIYKTIVCLFLISIIFFITCNLTEIELVDKSGTNGRLNNCNGIKLDLIIKQGSIGIQMYFAVIENGMINFKMGNKNIFDFNKELYMAFVVKQASANLGCPYHENSMYEAKNIILKELVYEKGKYEIELSNFIKIY
jgi:hypothetical protein